MGLVLAEGLAPGPHPEDDAIIIRCEQCPPGSSGSLKNWPSEATLRTHQIRVHGRRRLARWLIASGECPAYHCNFHTLLRAMTHVDREPSKRCLLHLLRTGRMLSPATVRRLDAQNNAERAAANCEGRSHASGLPATDASGRPLGSGQFFLPRLDE